MTGGDHVILATPRGRVLATCAGVWTKETARPIISNSSGRKDCMVNDAIALMERDAEVDAVALMSLPGPWMLYLLHKRNRWEDVCGVVPRITEVNANE
jgi:hypothetical protein